MPWDQHREALSRVRLLALDVDGVLTDGRIRYLGEQELQVFHVHDGQALRWLIAAGVRVAWITGRGCEATEKRARELGVEELHMGTGDKKACLAEIQGRLGVSRQETASVGDDLPDLSLAEGSGLFIAPPNAAPEVAARADFLTGASGGQGCVREVVEALLRARGAWEEVTGRGDAPLA